MNVFKIKLDVGLEQSLRETVNFEIHISLSKTHAHKVKSKVHQVESWNLICSIMDRIDDTVRYLNQLELNTGQYVTSAFDFYSFMDRASVLIDCIDQIAKIYSVTFDGEDLKNDIFNMPGINGKGNDKKFFLYLRSICSIHPAYTDRHPEYQIADFECCPYVRWGPSGMLFGGGDLGARIYTNAGDKTIDIKIEEIFKFVQYRYELLNKVIKGIEKYNLSEIETYKKKIIKTEGEFSTYGEYLLNLKEELLERYGTNHSF